MAANDSRSMNADFHQGVVDRSYIQLTPDRGAVENPPLERLSWPTYGQAERHEDHPHLEGHIRRSLHPTEIKTTYGTDPRF